jgi:hypothetical protein
MGARGAVGLGHGQEPAGSQARLSSDGKTGGSWHQNGHRPQGRSSQGADTTLDPGPAPACLAARQETETRLSSNGIDRARAFRDDPALGPSPLASAERAAGSLWVAQEGSVLSQQEGETMAEHPNAVLTPHAYGASIPVSSRLHREGG